MIKTWFSLWAFLLICSAVTAKERSYIGINYVREDPNLPPPSITVSLIKSLKFGSVKLYDTDPETLTALADSGLSVVVSAKSDQIPVLASSVVNAEKWLKKNVLTHYPATRITTIIVGNEVFSDQSNKKTWSKLLPAMQNLHSSLSRWKLSKRIKVTTSMAMDVLQNTSLSSPSSAAFRSDIVGLMRHLLKFLSTSKSPYYANIYPFYAWKADPDSIPLEYASLGIYSSAVEDGGFKYHEILSSQIDSHICAMEKLGFRDVEIAVGETGWPSAGVGVAGSDPKTASTYTRRLMARMSSEPPVGTPRRAKAFIPTYLYSLYKSHNKNMDWGLLYANGSESYSLIIETSDLEYVKSIKTFPATRKSLMMTAAPPYPHVHGHHHNPNPNPNPNPEPPIMSRPIPPLLPYYPPPSPPYSAATPPLPATNPGPKPAPVATYPPPCMPFPPSNPTPATPTNPIAPTPPVLYPPATPTNPIAPAPPVLYPPANPQPQPLWCVAKPTVPESVLQGAMDYACGAGGADCRAIQVNGPCFMPDTVISHASYAFNSYWQKNKAQGGTCGFGGTAMLITTDPSYSTCQFVAG